MRKPTSKTRRWNRIHAHRLNKRRLKFRRKRRTRPRQRNREVSVPGSVGKRAVTIQCPPDFSLETNFDSIIDILDQIRAQSKKQRNERIYIDFRKIKNISPSSALVLAAELDRWNHTPLRRTQNTKLRAIDVNEWDPAVRSLLADMGFFDLLRVPNPQVNSDSSNLSSRVGFVKFRTGDKVDGEAIEELRRTDLDPFVGVPNKHYLYAAVTEAMTNVVHHAYPSRLYPPPPKPNWWLSASRNAKTGEVVIMIYDQGAGIPETLPRKFPEQIRKLIPQRLSRDHARMIQAAHELSRSGTRQGHRGHGLGRDVREYVNILSRSSRYRVVSLQGEYIHEKPTSGQSTDSFINHNRSLLGTLIEWTITSQARHHEQDHYFDSR